MSRQRVYCEHGRPVEVLTWWGPGGGPCNVLIRTGEVAAIIPRAEAPRHGDSPPVAERAAMAPVLRSGKRTGPSPRIVWGLRLW
jgi:hypothetical protein